MAGPINLPNLLGVVWNLSYDMPIGALTQSVSAGAAALYRMVCPSNSDWGTGNPKSRQRGKALNS